MDGRDALWALYGRTHGVALDAVDYDPLPEAASARVAFWSDTFRALGFHTDAPEASSRALELAMAWATARGSAAEPVRALFALLGHTDAPPPRALQYHLRCLWAAAWTRRPVTAAAFDALRPLPAEVTPSQALLVLWFTAHPERSTAAEIGALARALRGLDVERTVFDVFRGSGGLSFWEFEALDPAGAERYLRSAHAAAAQRGAAPLHAFFDLPADDLPRLQSALARLGLA